MYDHNFKVELASKIKKIKNKKIQYNIFEIIGSNANNCSHNENGTFIFFQNLPDSTYEKLNDYINQIYSNKMKKEISNIVSESVNLQNKELDGIIADVNTEKIRNAK